MIKIKRKIALLLTLSLIFGTIPSLAYAYGQTSGHTGHSGKSSSLFVRRAPSNTSTRDWTAPVITLNGNRYVSIQAGTAYVDAGATARDNIDGRVAVRTSSNVNANTPGRYTVKYTATDSSGNTAYAYRKVEVMAAPVTEPVVTEPVVTEPVVTEPVVTEPVVTEPVVTEPVVTEPVVTEPVVTEPVVTEPVVTEPVVTEPVVTEPVVTEPVVTEPVVTEPVVTEPIVVEPIVVEPIVVEPIVVEPIVVEPIVPEPIVPELTTPIAGQSSTPMTSAVDSTMQKVYLSSFPNISGSLNEFTGTLSAGSAVLTLSTSAHDFKVGHGIAIKGASSNKETNYWLITTVKTVVGNTLTLSTNAATSVSGAMVLHDDTKAVNSATANGNAIYYFDIPQMNIKGLTLKSNAIYDGMGKAVLNLPVIYSSAPWVQSMVSAENQTNVTFRNFTLDGGKTRGVYANDQVGVSLMLVLDSTKVKVQNNIFRNNGYISINLQSAVNDILVEYNTILNTDIGIMAMPEWLGNLYLENAVFKNNYMDGGTSEGISIVSGMRENPGYAKNITIHQNIIKNKTANGIQYGSRTSNIVISENEVTRSNNGICSIDPNLESRINMTSTNADIIRNKVYNNKWSNLVLDGTDVYVANNEISQGNNVLVLGRLFINTVTVESNKFINTSIALSPAIHIYNLSNGIIKNNAFVIGSTTNFNAAIGTESGNVSNLAFSGNDLGGMRVLDIYKATTLALLDQKY